MLLVSKKSYYSSSAPEPVGAYPHARRVGNLLFLSGIGPREGSGNNNIPGTILDEENNIVRYDIEKQCHTVFKNVKTILEAAGAKWEDIIDVTVFLTNMKADFEIYNRIYGEYFKDNQPCRTTVGISSLPTPIAIELKIMAAIEDDFPPSGGVPTLSIPDRVSQDVDEVRTIIQFFRKAPSSKNECLEEVKRIRDVIMYERTTQAPYQATVARTFHTIVQIIKKENKNVQRKANREVIHELDQLLNYIYQNSK